MNIDDRKKQILNFFPDTVYPSFNIIFKILSTVMAAREQLIFDYIDYVFKKIDAPTEVGTENGNERITR